jgi:cytosine deaminase
MFDLIVKNANLPDGRAGMDIACAGGKIVAVERAIEGAAGEVIDAAGQLGVSETLCMEFSPCGFHGSSVEPFGI